MLTKLDESGLGWKPTLDHFFCILYKIKFIIRKKSARVSPANRPQSPPPPLLFISAVLFEN